MSNQRIRGQEVTVIMVRDGEVEDTFSDVQGFNFEAEFEVKSQGYLGEKTNRKDDIYNGCKFDIEMHLHSQQYFTFLKAQKDRASRTTPDVQFNISAVLNFPNGESPTVLIPDCRFGASPVNISSRGDYVKVKIQGEADDFSVTLG